MNNRSYDKNFKLNAVKLYREGKKTIDEIAKNLGIPKSTLSSWTKNFEKHGSNAFLGSGRIAPEDKEFYQLKKELASVREEREILKKALAIFSSQKGRN